MSEVFEGRWVMVMTVRGREMCLWRFDSGDLTALTGPVQAKADTTNQRDKENSIQRNGRQRAVLKGCYSHLEALPFPRVPLKSRVGYAIPDLDAQGAVTVETHHFHIYISTLTL